MDLSTSKGTDEVAGRIRWDFEEWELFVSLYLSRNPNADVNDPSFQLPKAEFLAIQDLVIREPRRRTAYYDVLKKAVGHMRKAKQRLDVVANPPLEPESWTEQHYRDVAIELTRLRPDLKLLFSDAPSGYSKDDILKAQLVLPEGMRREEVDLTSIQEPLRKALALIRGGATDTSIQLSLHGIGNDAVSTLKSEVNVAAERPTSPDPSQPDDGDRAEASSCNDITPANSESAPLASPDASASLIATTPPVLNAPETSNADSDFDKPLPEPDGVSDNTPGQNYREMIDYAAKAFEPLAKLFAQELAAALALELRPLIGAVKNSRNLLVPGSTAETSLGDQPQDADEATDASPGVSQVNQQSISSFEQTTATANAGVSQLPRVGDDEDDDELDTRLLRTPNLHESRLVESGWDHVAKPTVKGQSRRSEPQRPSSGGQNRTHTSTIQSQPVRKMRIGVVGMRARDANDLRNDYPDVEFTVVDRGTSDISVSLDQCDRVIGLAGGVPALADGLLKRRLGERYHIARSGAGEIRTTLDQWVTQPNQSLN